jgi:hypothetical protein
MLGVTFQSQTDGVFGVEVGQEVASGVEIYGSFNLMRNVLPRSIQDDLDDLGDILTVVTGVPWAFDAEVRAVTGVGGIRYRFPSSTAVRPYVTAGGGISSIRFKIEEIDLGDVTDDIIDEGIIDDDTATKPVIEFGGGVEFGRNRLYMDVGYRFARIVDNDGLNISRVYFGLGGRF